MHRRHVAWRFRVLVVGLPLQRQAIIGATLSERLGAIVAGVVATRGDVSSSIPFAGVSILRGDITGHDPRTLKSTVWLVEDLPDASSDIASCARKLTE